MYLDEIYNDCRDYMFDENYFCDFEKSGKKVTGTAFCFYLDDYAIYKDNYAYKSVLEGTKRAEFIYFYDFSQNEGSVSTTEEKMYCVATSVKNPTVKLSKFTENSDLELYEIFG